MVVEEQRYSRQTNLPEVGEQGQQRLAEASVLILGAGGLGVPAMMYLAAAGVGRLTIVDADEVELSNLHRQVLYTEADIGSAKAEVAAAALRARNSEITVEARCVRLDAENAAELIAGHDLLVDGSDNIPTRYAIDDACAEAGIPWVHASIHRFEGQISCFNVDGGSRYRDLFPEPREQLSGPNCAEAGVLGALPGMLGSIQAAEALKLLLGTGDCLAGKVLVVDAKTMKFRTLHMTMAEEQIPVLSGPHSLNPTDAQMRRSSGWEPFVIDVRNAHEAEIATLPFVDLLVEHTSIGEAVDQIPEAGDVLVYCHHGVRGMIAIGALIRLGIEGSRLYNLAGGIDAWSLQVDRSIRQY